MSQTAEPVLTRYGATATSVFDLLGRDEVDLTAALGWTLTRSPALMGLLWERLRMPGDPGEVTANLEVVGAVGRTDLELVGTDASVIVEAKKGWLLPGETQLASYAPRLGAAPRGLLVSLSDSSAMWAATQLPEQVAGVPVVHLPWDAIRTDVTTARTTTRAAGERLWLDQLSDYLAGATAVRDSANQWVYNVVVSEGMPGGGPHTFRDYVLTERVYFHPYGGRGGWPKRPPTFMAFRWRGRIRQVNRVSSYEVYPTLNAWRTAIPLPPDGEERIPHVVYQLGPDLPIPHIATTGTYASGRVWALLDQMLVHDTLQGAVRASKEIAPD